MALLDRSSLAATVDAVNHAFFTGHKVPRKDALPTANWIASRLGQCGSYCGLPAATSTDLAKPLVLFTGEKVTTNAGSRHILGQEACRAMLLLAGKDPAIQEVLKKAYERMMPRLDDPANANSGMYCCGKCSAALWRHLCVGGFSGRERMIDRGLRTLKSYRNYAGRWRRFPFYFTLLALVEMDSGLALAEMRYAAPGLERLAKRRNANDVYGQRRIELARRVLARC